MRRSKKMNVSPLRYLPHTITTKKYQVRQSSTTLLYYVCLAYLTSPPLHPRQEILYRKLGVVFILAPANSPATVGRTSRASNFAQLAIRFLLPVPSPSPSPTNLAVTVGAGGCCSGVAGTITLSLLCSRTASGVADRCFLSRCSFPAYEDEGCFGDRHVGGAYVATSA